MELYESVLTKRYLRLVSGVLVWVVTAWASAATSPVASLLGDDRDWLDRASQLVQIAQSNNAEASQFNKDVRESRARLRVHVRQVSNSELSEKHQQLHSTMLVMDVLLKSAAACQRAGYIACPPLLMSQLKTVLKNAYLKLEEIEETRNSFDAGGLQ